MTIEMAIELAEKARSFGPNLLLLVDNRHEALAHAQLAYSALTVAIDQLREAEQVILQLLESNALMQRALEAFIADTPVSDPNQMTLEGTTTVEFLTDTRTGIDNFPQIASALAREISDTFGG